MGLIPTRGTCTWHSAEICKYRVSIRTHVVEGICIPLDVRHDLVRNVTTRGRGRGNTCT